MLRTFILFVVMLISAWQASAQTWRITSLDWPPFSGYNLPEGGAGIAVLRAALRAEGIDLQVEYFPWSRALLKSREAVYLGVYPTWPEDVPPGFIASVALFKSPVGLVEPIARPIVWAKLNDLQGKSIGTVQDYGNTTEFMALIKSNAITTELVTNDLTNIRKVAAGRIDAAFIDLNNLRYYLKNDAHDLASRVQANTRIIDNKLLVVAINDKFTQPEAAATIKRGVDKINPEKIIKDYMEKYFK